jgi:hypothetical protein
LEKHLIFVNFSIYSALRRSKKRVRNVISTELPYIISTELSYSQNIDPNAAHSSEKVCSGDHVEKWKYLFMQMDKALQDEGKFLVSIATYIRIVFSFTH